MPTDKMVRQTHPYGYRSGDWARLLGEGTHATTGRLCYFVRFPDGASDFWPVEDEHAGYEFRPVVPSTGETT